MKSFLSDALENLKISIAGTLSVGRGGDVLTEIIEAGEHARFVASAGRGDGFIQGFARDEAARHAARGAIGSDPIGEAFAFGNLEKRGPKHARFIMAAWNLST